MTEDRNRPSPCPFCGRSNPWFYRTCSSCKASLVGFRSGDTTLAREGEPSWGAELLERGQRTPTSECVHCRNEQPSRLVYCRRCGRSTRSREEVENRHCGRCRAYTPDDDLFCLECGHPTRPGLTPPEDGFRDADCGRCWSPTDATLADFCGGCGGPLSAERHRLGEVVHALRAILATGRGYRDQAASLEPLPGRVGGVYSADDGVEVTLELLPSESGKADLELAATGAPRPGAAASWSFIAVALRLLAPARVADVELLLWAQRRQEDGEHIVRAEHDGGAIRLRLSFRSLPDPSRLVEWIRDASELARTLAAGNSAPI